VTQKSGLEPRSAEGLAGLAVGDYYYEDLGGGKFRSTIHAQGAWNAHEQHMAPASGIIAHCLALHDPRPELRIARIGYEILGLIHAGDFEVTTTTIRPGRTIELVQAELTARGRVAIRANAWRLVTTDSSEVAAVEDRRIPGIADCERWDGTTEWPGGYIRSLEMYQAPDHRSGSGTVWIRTAHPLVGGAASPDWVRLIGLVDTANGIATRVPPGPGSWMFPNVDLQIHLYREPHGEWLGIDNAVSFGSDGIGLTSSVLHDTDGPFGRAEQILTLRRS
jgi:hypothetical protein